MANFIDYSNHKATHFLQVRCRFRIFSYFSHICPFSLSFLASLFSTLLMQVFLSSEFQGPKSPLQVRLRIFHDLEKPRGGREILVDADADGIVRDSQLPRVRISKIQSELENHVGLSYYTPHVYSAEAECYVPLVSLKSDFCVAECAPPSTGLPRIDVKLIPKRAVMATTAEQLAEQLCCDSSDTDMTGTWFGIGILRGKTAANHGSLWRSALQFGAAMTFTIGQRYEKRVEGCADVYKTLRQIPCMPFPDITAFMTNCPIDAQIVIVEYGGTDLSEFVHPKRAMYVLGSEDCGIPPALVARAQYHVTVPTADGRPSSLNVAAAGAIIMYDRFVKQLRTKSDAEAQPKQKVYNRGRR